MAQTIEKFICKVLNLKPDQLIQWKVGSQATNRGLIENTLAIKTACELPAERSGSFIVTMRTFTKLGESDIPTGHEALILCLAGKETNELFKLLYKTMADKLGN